MSKIIKLSRRKGEFLTRFSKEYKIIGEKTPLTMDIEMPNNKAKFFVRNGKYLEVSDMVGNPDMEQLPNKDGGIPNGQISETDAILEKFIANGYKIVD